jgi:hypothetical protein
METVKAKIGIVAVLNQLVLADAVLRIGVEYALGRRGLDGS